MKSHSLALAALFASRGLATDNILTPEKLEADIKLEELERNLWNFDRIAAENGGSRAFGLPGYQASVDYILERAQTRFGAQYDTLVQPFNHTFAQVLSISVAGPDGGAVDVVPLIYNPGTDDRPVSAPLVDTPVDDERGSACFEDQWTGIDATGKLALVKRGTCAIADKLKLAKAHGAVGVILYNNVAGTPSSATLGAENVGLLVPVGTIYQDVGESWKARLAAGEELVVGLAVDSVFEERETWNVIVETKEGDPNNVIVLGAHLDSVQAGPGVNDDGSGSSALIEIMTALRSYTGFPNKVRFAWWGAEESGLIGSLHYTSSLTEEEADRIRFYFNYDMVGSPAPVFAVYTGDNPGDLSGAQPLKDYLLAAGRDAYFGSFGSSSDYVGFLELGIPSSGIFTGAGAPEDPCYHLACDTISNVDLEALTTNTKAAAVVAANMALSLEGVPPRNKMTLNTCNKNHIRAQFDKWKRAAEHASTEKSCSHKEKSTI
ncbi:peptidase family M28 [Hypoxylon rubiginosum]|uniref:Peptidase family M28 n=1 Tax=Hypoxylon rubiginosum TaxID=110542 RepID=A0ACC0DMB3_9PEZI|nr:peptidase family M28 [Hypoxylon rubiginosum]